jgi:GrpB-like predicted nucleotidyltransferase (UPF0157 family)
VIPGVSTKPVLDLLAEACDIGEVHALNPAMIALGFWDHLRAHPQEAQAYSRLKEELARRFPGGIEGYLAGKDEFIRRIEAQARSGGEGRATAPRGPLTALGPEAIIDAGSGETGGKTRPCPSARCTWLSPSA